MPKNDHTPDELASELTDSLKNCRSIVRDYRWKLGGAAPVAEDDEVSTVEPDPSVG